MTTATMEAPKPKKLKPALFKFKRFSKKQLKVLTWWNKKSPVNDKDGIICDGSVRAGKTVVMSLSYVMWAMETFNEENFGMAGKTIGSFRRNVITPLKRMLKSRGYRVKDHRADNYLTITKNGVTNYFYVFGGKDESSQDLIQGITLAGMFFDEAALMPESFVSQAEARCSVDGSKYWYNCNPASPFHWFKEKYIDKLEEKNLIRLHFTMDDNPSLSERVKNRYKRMFSGIFYQRFILGLWVLAEGVIYDMFNKDKHVVKTEERRYTEYYVSIDYGTQNPTTFGLWGKYNNKWYKVKEYFYDGRNSSRQKTDIEYSKDLKAFVKGIRVRGIIVDPSASSFIAQLKKDGFYVIKAKNDVLDGIRNVQTALIEEMIYFNDCCKETFREFSSYIWDKKAADRGEDKPVKQFDHLMDSDRYFVNTILFAPKAGISSASAW
ncbi:PBSX family phage terminase large subunit [Oceanobacillus sp. Castelsardo]|uniref:PBSX family phage terminase large subunit n=1 Tax=Oceanobacillus sp. Castelsardo TaxID=1851204 RepID=UPI000A7B3302|nr:PBSX family phage terminase large subunit [Oceanobacillus sp. Castelsardo]